MQEPYQPIGETAGKIYQALAENGGQSLAQLQKTVTNDTALLNQALGWLAREDKIAFQREGRGIKISLLEAACV